MDTAVLVLEDGRVYRGMPFGAVGETFGEAVFCTAMTGYQETLTDPSYHRQIVVATAPHIGNTGWNDEDGESSRIRVAGYAVRDPAPQPSNWRATTTLPEQLRRHNVVGIAGIDTRALVRQLRTEGSMKAGIFSGEPAATDTAELVARVAAQPGMAGADLTAEVTCERPYTLEPTGAPRATVVAVDLGMKANIGRMFAERGVRLHVVRCDASADDVRERHPDAVFLSNGPGDPATQNAAVGLVRNLLADGVPLFGICFGNQILGRALGMETFKMTFGHRGINVPVMDHATGRVAITSQNHGFALAGAAGQRFDTPFGPAEVSHTCANDGTVEGVRLRNGRAFSVQYHPEAAAGPHDAAYLFDSLLTVLEAR